MHDAHQLLALIHDWHCHDSVLLHAIEYRARELAGASELGTSRHDTAHRHRPQVLAVLDEAAQIPSRQYPIDVRSCVDDDGDATPLCNHDDRLPRRVSIAQNGKLLAEHDLFNLRDERPAEGSAGVQASKVLAPESLLLQ